MAIDNLTIKALTLVGYKVSGNVKEQIWVERPRMQNECAPARYRVTKREMDADNNLSVRLESADGRVRVVKAHLS